MGILIASLVSNGRIIMELVLAIKGGGGNLNFFQMFPLFHFDIIALHFAKISLQPI